MVFISLEKTTNQLALGLPDSKTTVLSVAVHFVFCSVANIALYVYMLLPLSILDECAQHLIWCLHFLIYKQSLRFTTQSIRKTSAFSRNWSLKFEFHRLKLASFPLVLCLDWPLESNGSTNSKYANCWMWIWFHCKVFFKPESKSQSPFIHSPNQLATVFVEHTTLVRFGCLNYKGFVGNYCFKCVMMWF